MSALWTGREVLIWGGYPDELPLSVGTGARCDPEDDQWSPMATDGARYSPTLDHWTPMTSDDAPAARQDHSAVWTGTEMIVWGGSNAISWLNSGGIYGFPRSWGSFADRPRATRREPPLRDRP